MDDERTAASRSGSMPSRNPRRACPGKKKKGVVSSYLQTRIGFIGITHLATTDLARDTRIWPARAATSAVVVDMAIA
jgi:hypothetical protein